MAYMSPEQVAVFDALVLRAIEVSGYPASALQLAKALRADGVMCAVQYVRLSVRRLVDQCRVHVL